MIAEQLQLNNTFAVRQELGYLYNQRGLLEQAEEINYYLWQETRLIAPEIRKTYYADALRNVGYLYYLQGKDFVARKRDHVYHVSGWNWCGTLLPAP